MKPPGTSCMLSQATTHAPMAAKVSWQSAIMPADPVTMPRPSTAIDAVTALMARKT